MAVQYTKMAMPNFVIPRHSKMFPNWSFWLENIPTGSPDSHIEPKVLVHESLKVMRDFAHNKRLIRACLHRHQIDFFHTYKNK
jgi:hypothetical protein